jgi:VCBS repeat-containing protein
VEFAGLGPFDKVVLGSGSNAFEVDNISAGTVPAPHVELAAPITGTISVSDADIGDTLTASVMGDAVITYNGHNGPTALPANVDFAALKAASAITFNSVQTNGGTNVLHWTYDPKNPDLDFLKSGDTLTITFKAQVDDGHGCVGDQALTITIGGADPSASTSGFKVVNGTSGNDTFNHVGNNVTIFGAGGHDTFVFNAQSGSATIGDFDVNNDTINIDQSFFATVSAFVHAAPPANSGPDTIITNGHDTLTLTGVTAAQLQGHLNDFHVI